MSEEIARPYDRAVASRGLSGRGRAMSYNVFDAMAPLDGLRMDHGMDERDRMCPSQ